MKIENRNERKIDMSVRATINGDETVFQLNLEWIEQADCDACGVVRLNALMITCAAAPLWPGAPAGNVESMICPGCLTTAAETELKPA